MLNFTNFNKISLKLVNFKKTIFWKLYYRKICVTHFCFRNIFILYSSQLKMYLSNKYVIWMNILKQNNDENSKSLKKYVPQHRDFSGPSFNPFLRLSTLYQSNKTCRSTGLPVPLHVNIPQYNASSTLFSFNTLSIFYNYLILFLLFFVSGNTTTTGKIS